MAGRNKTRKKQREYKEHCRVMRTTAHGGWTTNYRGIGVSEATYNSHIAK